MTCRWVVVMPRYPSPAAPPGTERLVRMLLVAFKGRDQCVPACKVWLDGAVARPVLGYKGSAAMQCALVLHTLHAAPTGAHITGDQSMPLLQLSCLKKALPVKDYLLYELIFQSTEMLGIAVLVC